MKKSAFGLLMVLTLSACSGGMMGGENKYSADYVQSHVIANKTTMSEVQALYGVPDSQSYDSNGRIYWGYSKSGNLSDASSLAGYIPGASAVSSALGLANSAEGAASSASTASNKLSGNTSYNGNSLGIWFNKNKVVDHWSL